MYHLKIPFSFIVRIFLNYIYFILNFYFSLHKIQVSYQSMSFSYIFLHFLFLSLSHSFEFVLTFLINNILPLKLKKRNSRKWGSEIWLWCVKLLVCFFFNPQFFPSHLHPKNSSINVHSKVKITLKISL